MNANLWRRFSGMILAAILVGLLNTCAAAQSANRMPIIIDTDIGIDIDDAFALGLMLGSHEFDARGVTTVGRDTRERAMMICRFLTMTGRRQIAVAAGQDPQPNRPITHQHPYYYHPDVLFDRTKKTEKDSAADFLYARLKAEPGKITLVALGPLTNVARLLREKPDAGPLLRSVVLREGNLALDIPAAQTVFDSGVALVVLPEEHSTGLKLDEPAVRRVFSPGTPLSRQVEALYQLWDQKEPPLTDVLTAALPLNETFARFADRALRVDDTGKLAAREGKANARLVTSVDRDAFVAWYVNRMASLVPPERNPSRFVEQGGMPHRIHLAEDFDDDIERRWWMSGKPEMKNLPNGSLRACRGVLTHDFDDLLMASRQMYTAVIFNPVPGPPMGKQPRLTFRYWLKGTDTLRVQIYSLTNGYHRHLVVKGLPQETWRVGTVDMTQARRPDGTGGPLSENERIDDIQFYADPNAELIIDDVVLYDAAAAGETRQFPKRILFTGLFDTGKQGQEWPGTFEIVSDQGSFWRAARSVKNDDTGFPWIRVHLRGLRRLGKNPQLYFRYRLTGADNMRVLLRNATADARRERQLQGLVRGAWAETTVDFSAAATDRPAPASPATGDRVDEIHFSLPAGAELLLDDLLLFEQGESGGAK